MAAVSPLPRRPPPPAEDQPLVEVWRDRIMDAKKDRERFEPTWLSNLAFASGEQWLTWHRASRTLRLDPELEDVDRYTADKIMQYRNTAIGELTNDDDRPEIQFRRDDLEAIEYAKQTNDAVGYGWEHEWRAPEVLLELRRILVDFGTGAIWCRFDPTEGPVRQQVPFRDGEPIYDEEEAHAHVAEMMMMGQQATFRDAHAGRITWEPLPPTNFLTPPGLFHERAFPWEIVVRPVLLSKLEEAFGNRARGLQEDSDIGAVFGLSDQTLGAADATAGRPVRLKEHCWLYTCYQRPTGKLPAGRTVHLASNDWRLLRVKDELPYQAPDGAYRSGLTYFHWWRVSGRFLGKSLIEALKDPQRSVNRRATQKNEIIDRGMPKVFVEEDSLQQMPRGKPLEKVNVKKGAAKPDYDGGIGPGEWMYRDIEALVQDMEEAAGIRAVSLGENPASVTNYSQLALLRENDVTKLKPTIVDWNIHLRELIENTVYDIRNYWGSEKQIAIPGQDNLLQARVFNATQIPPFFLVKIATGSPKPNSQAAQIQLIRDIADYSLNAGMPLPPQWLADSYAAGKPMPLPELPSDDQATKAKFENTLLLNGEDVPVLYFDPIEVHVPEHRSAQIQAWAAEDEEAYERIEQHILEHLTMAQQMIAQGVAGGQPEEDEQAELEPDAGPEGQ